MWTYLLIFLGTKIVWVLGLILRYNTFAEPARSQNRVLGAKNSWFGDLKPKHFWGLFFIISVIITTCSSVSSSISFPFEKYYLIRPLAFPLRPFFHEWSGWAKNPSAFNFWRSVHGKWSIFRRFPHIGCFRISRWGFSSKMSRQYTSRSGCICIAGRWRLNHFQQRLFTWVRSR